MQHQVFGCIKGKLQPHVVEGLGDDDATDKLHAAPHPIGSRHGGFGFFLCRDVETGVEGVACELHIAAILNGECFERYYRQGILHLAIAQGVAPVQTDALHIAVVHLQHTAASEVDIVGVVGIEVGHDVGTGGYIEAHVHHKSADGRLIHTDLRGVGEVAELHQFIELVVGGDRRIAQDICHIGLAEHIQLSVHPHVVQFARYTAVEIDKRLAIGYAVHLLLGVDYLEVAGLHLHVHQDALQIGKVHLALHNEG